MIFTFVQLIFIVVLLVPGFITIKTFTYLVPSKKSNSFDLTVASISFTLLIHGLYTTLMLNIYHDSLNNLIHDVTNKQWSYESSKLLLIYLPILLVVSLVLGIILGYLKDIAWIMRIKKIFGFHHSPFENLWDEIMFIYDHNNVVPNIIVHFEDTSYFGQVHRTTFDMEKSDKKEIVLSDPKYMNDSDDWQDCNVKLIYLDLKDAKSIYLVNGEKIIESKI
ncbi:DUF6338 family protein [Paenibacillus chitinolyticus]|uniref:DUF6338 family protein n=1 Tax=Paenibacillus chitinolyticus TaxID=79263 RepID=UPI00362F87C0